MVAPIKYNSLPCSICLINPADFDSKSYHTWHGHSVRVSDAREGEKRTIHGICSRCWPVATEAQRTACETCSESFTGGTAEVFVLGRDGTLAEPALSTEGRPADEAGTVTETTPLRRRNVLEIRTDSATATAAAPSGTPLWKRVTIGVSGGLIAASITTLIVVTIVCPPALAITAPLVVVTSLSSAGAIICATDSTVPRRWDSQSPRSLGSTGS